MALAVKFENTKNSVCCMYEYETRPISLWIDIDKTDLDEDFGLDGIIEVVIYKNHPHSGVLCGEEYVEKVINILKSFPHVKSFELPLTEECRKQVSDLHLSV